MTSKLIMGSTITVAASLTLYIFITSYDILSETSYDSYYYKEENNYVIGTIFIAESLAFCVVSGIMMYQLKTSFVILYKNYATKLYLASAILILPLMIVGLITIGLFELPRVGLV